jgi:hypothetical protein
MKKQVNVSLTYLFTFYPKDLGLDDTATRTTLMDYADVEIDGIIADINHFAGLIPNDIEVEVCEVKE